MKDAGGGAFKYVRARALASANLAAPESAAILGRRTIRWGRRWIAVGYLPSLLDEVHVSGYEHLPPREEPAPILAAAHRKIHDLFSLAVLVAGRPLHSFHDIVVPAQGALFSGIYPYRDLVPNFSRKRILRGPAILASRFLGERLRRLFTILKARPVYREGIDLPSTAAEFESPAFAGSRITGMGYDEFCAFARRETTHTMLAIQKAMESENRCLIILPEGRYRADGSVGELQGFLALTALRKKRNTLFVSPSYDLLCPDRLQRVECWIRLSPPLSPPASRQEMDRYSARGRRILQEETPVVAGHLLSLALRTLGGRGWFGRGEFEEFFGALARRVVSGKFPHDPGLADSDYLKDRLERFYRNRGRRWLRRRGNTLQLRRNAIDRYNRSEQTVDDIEWNCNQIRHLDFSELLK